MYILNLLGCHITAPFGLSKRVMPPGFTPGKKLDTPLPDLPTQTLNARLKTINEKKMVRFDASESKFAYAMLAVEGKCFVLLFLKINLY